MSDAPVAPRPATPVCTARRPRRGDSTARRCSCSVRVRGRSCSSWPTRASPPGSPSIPTSRPIRGAGSTARCAATCGSSTGRAPRRAPRSGGSTRSIARSAAPGYTARDPALSLWVHATLVDSTMAVADAWLEPLGERRRAAYYEETRPIGRAFGVPDALLPRGRRGVRRVRGGVARGGRSGARGPGRPRARGVRAPSAAARARSPGCRCPAAVYDWTLWPAVGLLPESVREEYGLRWGPRERARLALAGRDLAGLATVAAGGLPADAPGPRRRTRRMAARPTRRLTTLSRSAGSAARTTSRQGSIGVAASSAKRSVRSVAIPFRLALM